MTHTLSRTQIDKLVHIYEPDENLEHFQHSRSSPYTPLQVNIPQSNCYSYLYCQKFILPLFEFHITWIIQNVYSCVWLISLNIRSGRLISSVFLWVAVVHSFLLLCCIPCVESTTIYLSIPLLIAMWAISSFGLLRIDLLWISNHLCRHGTW